MADSISALVEGYFGTKQVHPDAVRFLNQHNVYLGDEIPSHLMSTISTRAGWLFTKEEHPNVTFWEMSDPDFGARPEIRSAVQGSTRVFSYSVTAPKRRFTQGRAKSASPKRPPVSASSSLGKRQAESAGSKLVVPATGQDMRPFAQQDPETSLMASSVSSSQASSPEVNAAGPENRPIDEWLQRWMRRGAYLPLWAIILILASILLIALLVSGS